MNCWLTTAGANVRSRGKCYSKTGSFCLVLLLLFVAQTSTRPTEEDDEILSAIGDDAEYGSVDNVEIHHVKIIDGVMHEDHPIVMYKEDFVNEDYDPSKNKTNRKYKNIDRQNRTQKYNILKPEKLYFDMLPQTPIEFSDDTNENKFDATNMPGELVSLVDNESNKVTEEPSKSELLKRPKKYHKRQRRDTAQHGIQKRNLYYVTRANAHRLSYYPGQQYLPPPPQPSQYPQVTYANSIFSRPPVKAKPPQPLEPLGVGSRGDFDDRIWGRRPGATTTQAPQTTKKAPPSIWHDSNPENFDFSAYSTTVAPMTERPNRRPAASTNTQTLLHSPAASQPLPASLLGSSQFASLAPEPLSLAHTAAFEQEARDAAAKVFFLGDNAAPSKENSACVSAENNCCEEPDISERFYCFEIQYCKRTIADISALCD